MNKIKTIRPLFAFLMVFSFSGSYAALGKDGAKSAFVEANEQYARGDYEKAVKTYKNILDEGFESFKLYYNLGNACYKLEKIPHSILYYEKAAKLNPSDKDLEHNLKLARLKTVDRVEAAPVVFYKKWWRSLLLMQSSKGWGITFLILFFTSSLLFIAFMLNARFRKLFFFSGLVLIFFAFVSLFLGSAQKSYLETNKQGIVFSPSVTVKSQPGTEAEKLFVIHEGTKVEILNQNNGWFKIELMNGKIGWLKESDIKKI